MKVSFKRGAAAGAGVAILVLMASRSAATAQSLSAGQQDFEQECRANSLFSAYHDCSCVASRLEPLRPSPGDKPKRVELGQLPAGECMAPRQVIYANNFQTCTAILKPARKDWESVCTCSTAKVVDAYFARPFLSVDHIGDLHREALKACSQFRKGDPS